MTLCTRKDEIQQDRALPVPDAADVGKVRVQDEEKDAAQETGHAHGDAEVTGICVVVEDAEQTLAANVDVALVHNAAEHHDGENLQGEARRPLYHLTRSREMKSHWRSNATRSCGREPRKAWAAKFFLSIIVR